MIPDLSLAQRCDLSRRLRRPDGDAPAAATDAWPPDPLMAASLVSLRVEADTPLSLNTDGECSESDLLEVVIRPEALRMRVPGEA